MKIIRFAVVGIANTIVDILVINLLLFRFPTTNTEIVLGYNALACAVASVNSFVFNRFWTFKYKGPINAQLLGKFALVSLLTLFGNTGIFWIFLQIFPVSLSGSSWSATVVKIGVAATMMFFSFLGQSMFVFIKSKSKKEKTLNPRLGRFPVSLTAVLPAYNEEEVIEETVNKTRDALSKIVADYEIVVVNDGSKDTTREIVERLCYSDFHVRLINHPVNKGAGAALVSGFYNAQKDYTFYMDSDGQFDIYDLVYLLPHLKEYDGVFGYRYDRQDPPLRKLNAWLWNRVVGFVFQVKIKDVDCAFKIFRTSYFREVKLEAKGALLLTEVVYKFARNGYRYTEVPVQHLPREKGKATGAKISVILKAFREMFFYANKWYAEENY